MKQTQFLTTVKITDGILLFNSLNGALVKLSYDEYDEMQRFMALMMSRKTSSSISSVSSSSDTVTPCRSVVSARAARYSA